MKPIRHSNTIRSKGDVFNRQVSLPEIIYDIGLLHPVIRKQKNLVIDIQTQDTVPEGMQSPLEIAPSREAGCHPDLDIFSDGIHEIPFLPKRSIQAGGRDLQDIGLGEDILNVQ